MSDIGGGSGESGGSESGGTGLTAQIAGRFLEIFDHDGNGTTAHIFARKKAMLWWQWWVGG
jgi:hypothetical protein